jgi:hypothetical protein
MLREQTGRPWSHLEKAAKSAKECRGTIEKLVREQALIPTDTSLITFGSLARDERTQGSDCDWTLLVDGLADGGHHESAAKIVRVLDEKKIAKPPGPTGVFGTLAYSHELVHQIGGEEDTNRNTTRRILLLLESTAIPGTNSVLVRERVIRQIIKRYLEQEPDLLLPNGKRRIPRFLLNDIVRYWRTMAVDYARKVRDRQADGWALRNIKLRLSRKLTFVSGMLTCFDCVLCPQSGESEDDLFKKTETRLLSVQEHILKYVESTPIEILAKAVGIYSPDDETRKQLACQLFDAYDSFLGVLDDPGKREALETLPPNADEKDQGFQDARRVGKDFQTGLTQLFFHTNADLTATTQEFGVF